jgi:hypothetical protein
LFEAARGSQDLLRIALAAAFAAPEEVPMDGQRLAMAQRNHDYFRSLVEEGQRQGELDSGRSAEELAFSLYGQLNIHLMVHLLRPGHPLTAKTARAVVDLFLSGAGANPAPGRPASGARRRRIAPETG